MGTESQNLFQVIATGKLAEGISYDDAVASFCSKFHADDEASKKMICGKPKIIKRNLDSKTATRYKEVLFAIGILSVIKPMNAPKLTSVAPKKKEGDDNNSESAQIPAPIPPQAPASIPPDQSVFHSDPNHPGFTFRIEGKPDYSFLTVEIPSNEMLKVEASAMATMDVNINMKTKMRGGLGRLLTGESMFINEFTAEGGSGEIGISRGYP